MSSILSIMSIDLYIPHPIIPVGNTKITAPPGTVIYRVGAPKKCRGATSTGHLCDCTRRRSARTYS